ncbi:MAG: hypothetical protein QG577_115 [Thermodesulfobacteriota bacterium]|nr:hypothetical protein [Thermodesulfobacteriota bacterium]
MFDLSNVDEIRDYLLSFDIPIGSSQERIGYVDGSLPRLLKTVQMVPQSNHSGQKLLELGASPYFLTLLLLDQTRYNVELANFFGECLDRKGTEIIESKKFGKRFQLLYENFNAERERFPYIDGSFSIVLCCEIIEHLTIDPTFMLNEIHRILEPKGYLLITTPNVLKLENVLSLLGGRNIFHPYSGYGVYGRHQREYTHSELSDLVSGCGYEIIETSLDDLNLTSFWKRICKRLGENRRDHIFLLARRGDSSRFYYPSELYCSTHAIRRVVSSQIKMGWNDVGHLGSGWWQLELSDPPLRWTEREAHVYLKVPVRASFLEAEVSAGPEKMGAVRLSLSIAGSEATKAFDVKPDIWAVIRLPLPGLDGMSEVKVVLSTDTTRNPKALGLNEDFRDLGVMVRRVSIR